MTRSHSIKGLDGLRAIAVLLVFFEHKTALGPRLGLGGAGVLIFFVLSGYLITSILLSKRHLIEQNVSSKSQEIISFFNKRSFRIFPPYFAMLAFVIGFNVWMRNSSDYVQYVPLYVTYTTNIGFEFFIKHWRNGFLGSMWTLAVEEQFYLIAAPAFLMIPLDKAKYAVWTALGLGLAAFIVLVSLGFSTLTINVDSVLNFSSLAVGSALALNGKSRQGCASLGVVLAFVATLAVTVAAAATSHSDAALSVAIQRLAALTSALLIWAILDNQNSLAVRVLELGALRRLGIVSYAFYLWHQSIDLGFLSARISAGIHNPHIVAWVIQAAEFGATVAISAVSWKLVEQPAMRLRDHVSAPRPDRALHGLAGQGER